jgi:hypothetical protein
MNALRLEILGRSIFNNALIYRCLTAFLPHQISSDLAKLCGNILPMLDIFSQIF